MSSTDLGAIAIKGGAPLKKSCSSRAALACAEVTLTHLAAALERAGVAPIAVDEVFMGNVCSANLGQVQAG